MLSFPAILLGMKSQKDHVSLLEIEKVPPKMAAAKVDLEEIAGARKEMEQKEVFEAQ